MEFVRSDRAGRKLREKKQGNEGKEKAGARTEMRKRRGKRV